MDDGSTDGSVEVAASLGREDARVRVIRQAHAGPAAALNTGVVSATGEYVSFLDSDDLWEPSCVERRLAEFRTDPSLGAVLADWTSFGDGPRRPSPRPSLERTRGDLLVPLFRTNFFYLCATMVPASVAHAIGPFDSSLGASEDYDWGLRLAARYPMAFLEDSLVRCRSHRDHIMADPRAYRFRCEVLRRFVATHPGRIPRSLARDRLAEVHAMVGGDLLSLGEYAAAGPFLARSLRYRPLQAAVWKALLRSILHLPSRRRQLDPAASQSENPGP